MKLNDLPATPELAARDAALMCSAEHGQITQSKMSRYHGIPYGDSGRALRAMQAAGEISGPVGERGERYRVGVES